MSYQRHPNPRRGRNQGAQMEQPSVYHEIDRLNALLNEERARSFSANHRANQLWQDLQDTKVQLDKQKNLKEIFIKKEKEVRQQYERLQKYTDAETLSCAKIGSQVQSSIKQKKKKLLQLDYEELKVAHVTSQQQFASDLRLEKDKTEALQRLLDEAKHLTDEMSSKHQVEVASLHQQVVALQDQATENKFQHDLQKTSMEKKIQAMRTITGDAERKMKQYLELMSTTRHQLKKAHTVSQEKFSSELRLEKEKTEAVQRLLDEAKLINDELSNTHQLEVASLHQQAVTLQNQVTETERQRDLLKLTMEVEIQALCQVAQDAESKLKQELEQISTSYDQLKVSNGLDVEALKVVSKTFLSQLNEEIQASVQTEPLPETTDVQPRETKKSFWKKTRHFFGLRKPDSWKKNKNASN